MAAIDFESTCRRFTGSSVFADDDNRCSDAVGMIGCGAALQESSLSQLRATIIGRYQGKNGPGSGELCQPTRPPVFCTTSIGVWVGGSA